MNSEAITKWTKACMVRERRIALLGMVFIGSVSVLVLAATLFLSAGALWLALAWIVDLSAWSYLLLATCWIALLFFGHARLEPGYLADLPFELSSLGFRFTRGNFNPLEPKYIHGIAKIAASVLFLGPRLAKNALGLRLRYERLTNINYQAVGAVLAWLAEQPGRVSMSTLQGRFPEIALHKLMQDLRFINGVLYLTLPEPGLSLSDTLRRELTQTTL